MKTTCVCNLKNLAIRLFALAPLASPGGLLDRTYSPLEFSQSQAIAAFVNQAAEALQTRGEVVFDEMNVEGPWCDHKTGRYVFVYDSNLVTVVNAGFPEMRGRRVGAEDPRKFYACNQLLTGVRSMVWAHADWRDAATGAPGCKSALLRLVTVPGGARYIVGSGALNLPIERCFIEELVDSAVTEYEAQGTNAFALIRQPDGPFRFRDFYIFVDTPQHVELVNPAFPSVEGQDFSDVKGADGRYFVREYIAKALTDGAGWTEYEWPRPGETAPSKKRTFTRKAEYDGTVVIIGAGLYVPAPAP